MEGRKPSPERYNELKRWVAEHKRKRKAIFKELNFSIKSQLAAFRQDVIIPIIESIEDSVRLNKQLNLALSGRHSRFQDNSMDLSEPRRQFPEVVVETVPLFPLELPSKDILEIEVMIEHISDILLFLWEKFGHIEMDLNVYFASHTTPIYAYLTASSKLRIHSPILFAKWRFIDLIHDDELQSEAGRIKDHGYHRIHVLE